MGTNFSATQTTKPVGHGGYAPFSWTASLTVPNSVYTQAVLYLGLVQSDSHVNIEPYSYKFTELG
jgi:hypothetical protein